MTARREPLAVVGMSCRFPGAPSLDAYWALLEGGGNAVSEVPSSRWDVNAYYDPRPGTPGATPSRFGGFIDDVDRFDAAFFGISPREARSMDPQHRVALEVAWEALEHAAEAPDRLAGSATGVFLGIYHEEYGALAGLDPCRIDPYSGTGGARALAANRISDRLDLRGPSLTVDTTCSSSLVAIHQACQALWLGDCDAALAGGVNLMLSPLTNLAASQLVGLAPDGRCKTFDAAADGIVRGEGCGIVVLKRLGDARRNGDRVLAVLHGSAVNQDGLSNGLTAPNPEAQAALVRHALAVAGLEPADISFVETHGTGTVLGDPIEVAALASVFGGSGRRITLGAVKSNIGHLEAAAGVAAFIKVVLCLMHGRIPPNLHLATPNPELRLRDTPFDLPSSAVSWPRGPHPRYAGVSSFSIGGTNAHAVLGESPVPESAPRQRTSSDPHVVPLSAATADALHALARRYADSMPSIEAEGFSVADLCLSAAAGRSQLSRRAAIVAPTFEAMRAALASLGAGVEDPRVLSGVPSPQPARPVFVFSGQGCQWAGMGRALLDGPRAARAMLEQCDAAFRRAGRRSPLDDLACAGPAVIGRTAVAQPLIFIVQMAIAAQLRDWGVEPDAVVGHSLGEIAAVCTAGGIDLDAAVRVVCGRSEAMSAIEGLGSMVAAALDEEDARRYVAAAGPQLSIAAINAPGSVVISGESRAIDRLIDRLGEDGVAYTRLPVDCAFHSPQVARLGPAIEKACAGVETAEPVIPVVSSVTGEFSDGRRFDAEYWRRNALEPVRFASAIEEVLARGPALLVEIAPHGVLRRDLLRLAESIDPETRVVSTGRRGRDDVESLITAAGTLFVHGCGIDWRRVYPSASRLVPLPWYPWQRARHWHDDLQPAAARIAETTAEPASYELQWLPDPAPRAEPAHALDLEQMADRVRDRAAASLEIFDRLSARIAPRVRALCGLYVARALATLDRAPASATRAHGPRLDDRVLARLRELALCCEVEPSPEAIARAADALAAEFPECADEWLVLRRCGDALGAVIDGSTDPLHLLFGDGAGAAVERLYRASPFASAFNPVVADVLDEIVALTPGPLRILEVGAGTGGTTASVLPRLPPHRISYEFTDVSPRFLAGARRRFGDYPFLSYSRFDVEIAGETQGFSPGTRDVVIAANVLHATRDVGRCLDHVRALLKPGGTLVLLEGTSNVAWATLTFGLTDGWSKFDDAALRSDGPLLASRRWLDVLDSRGFRAVEVIPSADRAGLGTVIVATAPDAARRPHRVSSLILADEPLAGALQRVLAARGEVCVAPAGDGAGDALGARVRAWRATAGPEARVVHAWGVMPAADGDGDLAADAIAAATRRTVGSVVDVVQALAGGTRATPLWVVTSGVCSAATASALGAAAVRGLGRTLAAEHPDLWGGLVDVEPGPADAQAESIVSAIESSARGEDVVIRNGERRVARLRARPDTATLPSSRVRPDATYLITGGLGGIGLALADWLVAQGAGRIVLAGRRGSTDAAGAAVAHLAGRGTEIRTRGVDVTDRDAVAALVFESSAPPFPLRGVIHAAGVVEDGVLVQQEWTRMERVMAPKIHGGWNLHLATRGHPLDWFLLFSSAASLLGLPGLASYAAANAFLDALAHYRRGRGLPAVSINWSGWARTGMAAAVGEARETQWRARGLVPMSVTAALAECGRALDPRTPPQIMIGAIDWLAYARGFPKGAEPRLFDGTVPAAAPPALSAMAGAVAGDERHGAIADFVTREIRRTLLIDPGVPLSADTPLTELGVDSLMAVELRNSLSRATGAALPSTIVYDCPTIDALSAYLLTATVASAPPAGA